MVARQLTDDERSDLRDKFAAKAMQGFLAHDGSAWGTRDWTFGEYAAHAFELADAMLAEREK